jgi:heme exporter protein CcmD
MSELLADPHLGFIVAAYGVAAVVIAGMIGSVTFEYRRLSAHLDQATRALEAARGGSRRL